MRRAGTQSGSAVARFRTAALAGLVPALVVYVYVLWGGRLDPLRRHQTGVFSNFYDLQARALFHGHWWVPPGRLGVEAFVVDGREYMYFGPFPALLRMPVLLVTSGLDGRLTAPSMLLAWMVAALFAALLLWRMRVVVRGDAALTRAEAIGAALFLAGLMGGSSFVFLATQPAVYYEAIAWGVAWAFGALFALVGVLERPSRGGVILLGWCLVAAVLSRATLGWGCVAAAAAVGVWYLARPQAIGRRRAGSALLAVSAVAVAVGVYVSWAKFGEPFVQPLADQVYLRDDPSRAAFLAANGNSLAGFEFAPTNLLAYFRPDGLRVSSLYPFVMAPATPPHAVGGAVFDRIYRTPSIPASMPMLFALSCLGGVVIIARRRWRRLLAPLLGAGIAASGAVFFGAIAPRYLADFLPVMLVAGGAGLWAIFARCDARPRDRRLAAAAIAVLAGFGILANLGIASESSSLVSEGRDLHRFVSERADVADALGRTVPVAVADELPPSAPAGTLVAAPGCDALYAATGETESPQWLAVERGPRSRIGLVLDYRQFGQGVVPLVTSGDWTLSVEDKGIEFFRMMRLRLDGPRGVSVTPWTPVHVGEPRAVDIELDVPLHHLNVGLDAKTVIDDRYDGLQPPVVWSRDDPGPQEPQVVVHRKPTPDASLCRSLTEAH